ncbi:MAG: hypothetical protein HS130_01080 [Deltaproteobacteria bacterium]|nr:hypothetical protein [Deltaproteobacteria bacterium]MCL4873820.1 hypothetical protein [bacterium]
MNKIEIARYIKALRIKKFGDKFGAQKKFADFLGIKYTTYRENERGKIGIEVLKSLHEKMGIDLNELLSKEDSEHLSAAEEEAPYRPLPLVSNEEKEYMEKLLEVLRNPKTKKAIQENIDTFLQVPKPEPERKKKEE